MIYNDVIYDGLSYPLMLHRASLSSTTVLEWVSDIQISYDGTENRLNLLDAPRHTYNYVVNIPLSKTQPFEVSIYNNIRETWLVPVWQESAYVGAIQSSTTSTNAKFKYDWANSQVVNGTPMLIKSTNTGAYAIIKAILTDDLTTVSFAEKNIDFTNAIVTPIVTGIILGDVTSERGATDVTYTISFQAINYKVVTGTDYPTLFEIPVYPFKSIFKSDTVKKTLSKPQQLTDFKIGIIQQSTPYEYSQIGYEAVNITKGIVEFYEYINWVTYCAGPHKVFWISSQRNDYDFVETEGLIGTMLTVTNTYIVDDAPFKDFVMISFSDGISIAVKIAQFIKSSDTSSITLRLAVSIDRNVSSIVFISFMSMARYNKDSLSIKFIGSDVCEMSMAVLEIKPNLSTPNILITEYDDFYITENRKGYLITEG